MEDKNNSEHISKPTKPSNVQFSTYVPKPISLLEKEREAKNEVSAIAKKEKVGTEIVPPKNTRKIILIIFLAILSFVIIATTLLWIYLPKPTQPSDITLVFNVNMEVGNLIIVNPDGSTTTQERTKMMPGDKLEGKFQIKAESEEGLQPEVFIRIRSYALCEQNYYSNLFSFDVYNESEWYLGADRYYYYNGTLSAGDEAIDAIKAINFNKNIDNKFSNKSIQMIFEAEALQAEYQAIREMWPTAPNEWSNIFKG